jgi:hypothetical protein
MTSNLKLVVEKHPDGYVAYPLGIGRGAIIGQGDSDKAALCRRALGHNIPYGDIWR